MKINNTRAAYLYNIVILICDIFFLYRSFGKFSYYVYMYKGKHFTLQYRNIFLHHVGVYKLNKYKYSQYNVIHKWYIVHFMYFKHCTKICYMRSFTQI